MLLKYLFVNLQAALSRLAESSAPADLNQDSSSSKPVSFPFTRILVYHFGLAHTLEKLSSIWACLANGSELG